MSTGTEHRELWVCPCPGPRHLTQLAKEPLAGPGNHPVRVCEAQSEGQEGRMEAPGFCPEAQLVTSADSISGSQKQTTFAIGFHRILPVLVKDHTKAPLGAPKKTSKMDKTKNGFFHFQHILVRSIQYTSPILIITLRSTL